ncbi:MAG: tRNA pseudouridine(55) synthase TruB [Clostridiales bacterium]|nr:tRNA pseudouridine(55) synthase TruB [Clostridiales bacterium]
MNGFLIANKPTGCTSSNVVVFVRKRLPRGTTVGHGGTLDPEASGVLPVCVGSAARLFDYIIDKKKTYVARIKLGEETDTQDATGQVVKTLPVTVGEAELKAVLPRFEGEIEQIPPMYSALKRDGKRLYKLARKGEVVELEPRKCRVDGVEFLGSEGDDTYLLRIHCGKGVYIRTLCHDIGQALGCGAHMKTLERTAAGIFTLENALTQAEIDALFQEGRLEEALLPLDAPLEHLPRVDVHGERVHHAVKNGNPLKKQWIHDEIPEGTDVVRIYFEGVFAGIGQPQADGSIKFKAMLYPMEGNA